MVTIQCKIDKKSLRDLLLQNPRKGRVSALDIVWTIEIKDDMLLLKAVSF